MHLDEGRIQRLLDAELEPAAERVVDEHVAACEECRVRVAEARRDAAMVAMALGALDGPAPVIQASAVAARAQAEAEYALPRQAAGFLIALVLAGAAWAAYAAPGSPVPAWVDSFGAWLAGRPAERGATAAPPGGTEAGIAVAPGTSMVIVFRAAQAAGTARVWLTDGAEVVIRAGQGAASFGSDDGRLIVDNTGSTADFMIEIPRSAERVEIRLGPDRLLLKEGARVIAVGGETAEPFLLPLSPARP